jgi:ATP-dependent exoDNAse (exonuclease V) alpha subunit
VGTRKLAKLLDHADAAHAKVVLVGDHHQLPEIDAGGAFAGLASRLGSIKLHENRRQRADWERRALSRLRAGSTDRAIVAYQTHGRVHVEPDIDAARHRLVNDWTEACRSQGAHAMLAQQCRDVDELNRLARERLRAEGHIGLEDTLIGGRAFAIGDEVLATRNDYNLDILNGTRATITDIDQQNGTVRARTVNGREITFPSEYLSAGNLSHAYATTFHKAQGTTVRQSFLLVRDTIDREYAYSGLSRGVEANSIYLADHGSRIDDQHAPELEPHALDRLGRGLHSSAAKDMARDLEGGIAVER